MSTRSTIPFSPWAWAALAVLSSAGACTLLVDARLSDKPDEATGGGGLGGLGGLGGASSSSAAQNSSAAQSSVASSSVQSSSVQSSSAQSSSAQSSSSSGGLVCPPGTADCDGNEQNGCEAMLNVDPMNCGKCQQRCSPPQICLNGKCK
jgi:hypothetical protein